MFSLARKVRRTPVFSTGQNLVRRPLAFFCAFTGALLWTGAAGVAETPTHPTAKPQVAAIPLSFEANNGQTDGRVKFLSKGDGYSLFLTPSEAVFRLRSKTDAATTDAATKNAAATSYVVRMALLGTDGKAQLSGAEAFPGTANYLIGRDPAGWQTDVKTYGKVKYASVYPGVDAVFYGNQRQLEYDFVVTPGADPAQIALGLAGARPALDAEGNVSLKTPAGDLLLHKPVVYQGAGSARKIIDAGYTVAGSTVRFRLGRYDHTQELVIDPKFDYLTYLGGSNVDYVGSSNTPYASFGTNPVPANSLAIDTAGNSYLVGTTFSDDFPTKSGFEDKWAGYNGRNSTAFVSKINPTGTALVYSTYLGGTTSEQGIAIAVDTSGEAYVVGQTQSIDFPVTGGAYITNRPAAFSGFVTKLNAAGNKLVYSTYLGGAGYDAVYGIALDSKDQAYVVGNVSSCNCSKADYPLTANALLKTENNFAGSGFVTVLNAAGSSLLYSTLIGDVQDLQVSTTAQGVAVDASDNFYVTGYTQSANLPVTKGAYQTTSGTHASNQAYPNPAFAAKFGPVTGTGNLLTYLTYLRATGVDSGDFGSAIAVDSEGDAYVAGNTYSTTYPTTKGAYQTTCPGGDVYCGFVSKLNPAGTGLVWSTLIGNAGTTNEGAGPVYYVSAVSLDALGNVYLAGQASSGFPEVNPVQPNLDTDGAGFITKFNPTGTALLFSSMVGDVGTHGWIAGSAVDTLGNIYVAGATGYGSGIPVTPGALQPKFGGGGYDGFAAKIHVEAPDLTITKTHTGSFKQGESAAMYTITVSNAGDGASNGTVTVTDGLPTGLTFASMEGSGWTCKETTCTRTDALAVGKSYPAIAVGVDVTTNAPATVTNTAKVSGGGEYNLSNDEASDPTTITPNAVAPTVKATPSATTITPQEALTVKVTVSAASGKPTPTGSVKLTSGSYASAAVTLKSGAATISIAAGALAVGTDTLTTTYTPDATSAPLYEKATYATKVTVKETAATAPKFSPAAGTYTSIQTVTMTDTTKGAVIYYTTNGSTPTASSTKYTAAIKVAVTETLKAIAIAPEYTDSPVTSATYTIKLPAAATPAFSPKAGSYTSAQSVKITSSTSGAVLYYTTNGSTPTTSSTKYSAAVKVAATETLKAIAVATGHSNSAVGTAAYTIK